MTANNGHGPVNVVLGAGPAGLAAAWALAKAGEKVRLVEISGKLGGLAGTFEHGPFLLDYGPHKFYTRMPHIMSLVREFMGDELMEVPKVSGIWFRGSRFNYPLAIKELLLGMGPWLSFLCGLSYAKETFLQKVANRPENTYEDWVVHRFGRTTYDQVFQPLANKIWGTPENLDADLAKVRIVLPNWKDLILRSLFGDKGRPEISAKTYFYPKNGFGRLWDRLAEEVKKHGGEIHLKTEPLRIETEENRAARIVVRTAAGEETWEIDKLVSTIPLSPFLKLFQPAMPPATRALADSLKYRASILMFLVCEKKDVLNDAWIFVPEAKYVFNRISEQRRFSPHMGPEGRTVVIADISTDMNSDLWKTDDKGIFDKVMAGLADMGVLKTSDVTEYFTVRTPRLYPVYERGMRAKIDRILDDLERFENVRSIGRHGFFQHNNSDNAMDMGIQAAEHLRTHAPAAAWKAKRDEFHSYQIVD